MAEWNVMEWESDGTLEEFCVAFRRIGWGNMETLLHPMTQESHPTAVLPPISLKIAASVLGSRHRLKMLRELALSESGLIIVELAERLKMPRTNVAKHLKVLRDQGLVVANRAKMHRIPPERLVSREEAVIDYGTCLLRLGAAK